MLRRTLRLAGLSAVCALAATVPAIADAAQKHRVLIDRFSAPFEGAVNCSDFGPYDFANHYSGRQRVQVTDVVASDGAVLQTVFHTGLHETERNSQTGFSLPLRGSVHEVWDYASNTRTLTVAGKHEAYFGGGIDYAVCRALAAG